MMKTKVLPLIIISLLLCASNSYALRLGEIASSGVLGQPVNFTIEVTDMFRLNPDEVKARIATEKEHDAMGVAYPDVPLDLKIVLESDKKGHRFRITSNKPVREPYVNFILHVESSQSQQFKEYTLFLDLPTRP
ncbi:MAG: hypothetical protein V7711_00415 [Pseudomonadales bacterium]